MNQEELTLLLMLSKTLEFLQDHKLSIIGGPDQEAQKLRVKIKELNLQERITVTEGLNVQKSEKFMQIQISGF